MVLLSLLLSNTQAKCGKSSPTTIIMAVSILCYVHGAKIHKIHNKC